MLSRLLPAAAKHDIRSVVMLRLFQGDMAAFAARAEQSKGTLFKPERHLMRGQDGYLHY